jgi:CheY-like chemotaxis protein
VFVQEYGSERGFTCRLLELPSSRKRPLFGWPVSEPWRCITEFRRKSRDTAFHKRSTSASSTESTGKKTQSSGEGGPTSGNEVILLVEDEVSLRAIMQKVLQQCGYRIIPAENGVQALELWRKHRDEIQLVLTDLVMPEGLSGMQLAKKLRADNPKLKVVYTSGIVTEGLNNSGEELIEGTNFVAKPFRRDTLTATVRRCFDSD